MSRLHTERLLLPFRPRRRWLARLRAIGAAVVRWHLREPNLEPAALKPYDELTEPERRIN